MAGARPPDYFNFMARFATASKNLCAGFTLVEMLVASAMGALLIVATGTIFAPQLRMHQRLEGRTRLQERWARVNFLLDTEIQEAHQVELIPNGLRLVTCKLQANIIEPDGNQAKCSDGATPDTSSPGEDIFTDYSLSNGSLVRSGPVIEKTGSLNMNVLEADQVVITGVTEFKPDVKAQDVTYTLSFRDPADPNGSTYTNKSSAARARVTRF